MHIWGDEWFNKHGEDLYNAERYIWTYVKKYTRCNLMSKEKYGTIRYESVSVPTWFWKTLRFKIPFCYTRFGPKLWFFECSWLGRQWVKFGWIMTYRAVKNMIKKYPHLEHELMEDLASNEWLVGPETHKKYWSAF